MVLISGLRVGCLGLLGVGLRGSVVKVKMLLLSLSSYSSFLSEVPSSGGGRMSMFAHCRRISGLIASLCTETGFTGEPLVFVGRFNSTKLASRYATSDRRRTVPRRFGVKGCKPSRNVPGGDDYKRC